MKTTMKWLLLSAAMIAFTACSDDDDSGENPQPAGPTALDMTTIDFQEGETYKVEADWEVVY